MTGQNETLEQAMWRLFVHTAHEVCPEIGEQDIEIVLRTRPDLFDMVAGTVMRAIRLQMLSAEHCGPNLSEHDKDWADWALRTGDLTSEHHHPDSDHADEQRETDQRRCFAGDCAQDGLASVDGAEPGQRALSIRARGPIVAPADAPTGATTTGEAKPLIQGRWPSDSLGKTEVP